MRNLIKENIKKTGNNSSRSIKKLLKQRSFVVIISILFTGLGASITSIFFKTGIYFINNWRLELLDQFPSIAVLPAFGAVGGAIAGFLIKNIAPAAKGSGVSQIMGFLRHKKVPMNLKVGLVKLVSGIIAIGSGFPLGPEGPSVQMGGSVAWQMARWLKAPLAFRRVLVAAGGGAGIAAVFSAPLGGFIYAIEELLNSARPIILLLVVITTFIADSSADIIQALGLDPKAGGFDFNLGFLIQKEYDPSVFFLPIDFIYLVLLGVIIGLFAELYSKYVLAMQDLGKRWYKNKFVLKMSICGLLLGSIYSFLPSSFHNLDELQKIIVDSFDTGYTDETGLREIVTRGANRLSEVQLVKEKNIMSGFMKEVLSTKGNLATYGYKQIEMALEMGAVDHLLISEGFEKMPNIEKGTVKRLGDMAQKSKAAVTIISTDSEEGISLQKAFGGLAAMLRYPIS